MNHAVIDGRKVPVSPLWKHVAGIMAGWYDGVDEDKARKINLEGWGFDCYAPGHEYITERDFTRYEGLTLSDEELERAITLAKTLWPA